MELNNQDHAQVPLHSDCVDGEEDQKEWQLESRYSEKPKRMKVTSALWFSWFPWTMYKS